MTRPWGKLEWVGSPIWCSEFYIKFSLILYKNDFYLKGQCHKKFAPWAHMKRQNSFAKIFLFANVSAWSLTTPQIILLSTGKKN